MENINKKIIWRGFWEEGAMKNGSGKCIFKDKQGNNWIYQGYNF
jgi:hypothetical protein